MRMILIATSPRQQMYICICNAVTDREIRQAAKLGAVSLKDLRDGLGVATNCGKCSSCANSVLQEALSSGECPAHLCASEAA